MFNNGFAVPRIDFGAWVYEGLGDDKHLRARHRSFISAHVLGGALAAAVFSIYFALIASPTPAALLALLCFMSPLAIAYLLSKTGRLDVAHLLSAGNLTALVCLTAAFSGGVFSFAVVWLILVPVEGALSADRRVMIWSTGLAVAGFAGLHVATALGLFAPPAKFAISSANLALLSNMAAAIYACSLAAGMQRIHRNGAQELEESREHYRLIAENTSDLITHHEADGRISFASLASRELLGRAPEILLRHGLDAVLEGEDLERCRKAVRRCSQEGRPVKVEFQLARPKVGDGDDARAAAWLEMSCQPVGSIAGSAAGNQPPQAVLAVTRDITLRKARELERARSLEVAQSANRAKTQFIAKMSHELRTPLNAIIGFAEFLHRELLIKSREPRQADYCRIIHESGEHLLSLVNDLLDVTKIDSGRFEVISEPFEMEGVARSAVEILRPAAAEKSVALHLEIYGDLPELNADRRACKQILINLLSNACKFTPEGGEVSLSLCQDGDDFEIVVRDTGIGIAEEHLSRLGEAFYQAETSYARRHEGAGLGLSIVRGLVELHGGTMRIESVLGSGTVVRICVPNGYGQANGGPAGSAAASVVIEDASCRQSLPPQTVMGGFASASGQIGLDGNADGSCRG